MRRQASILVGLLWCVAILAVVVVTVLHGSQLDLRLAKNQGDQIQAHYLAIAGAEKAKALLFLDARQRRGEHVNHSGKLYNDPTDFRDVPLGRGKYRVIKQGGHDENDQIIYGIADEESRLNINYAGTNELEQLPDLKPEVAACILDYRDRDSNVTQGGAEAEEYAAMSPPYQPRNGPLRTVREMLMVRGVTRQQFMGEDANQNGLLDPEENDADTSDPPDNADGHLDAGWSGLVTVDSSVQDVDAAGEDRINIQEADEKALTDVQGITSEIAKAMVQWRGQNRFESLADLLAVRAMQPNNAPGPPGPPGQPGQPSPQRGGSPGSVQIRRGPGSVQVSGPPGSTFSGPPGGGPQPGQPQPAPSQQTPTGPTLINEQLLMDIADRLTVGSTRAQAGAVNINTAPPEVLACLPRMNRQIAEAIIRYRSSSGYFPNIAWLLKVDGIDREVFKALAPRVTARSETFRILSEGEINSSGARKRIQTIVRVSSSGVETISYREDL